MKIWAAIIISLALATALSAQSPDWPYQNSVTTVARALNVEEQAVVEGYALGLPDELTWMVILMGKACACPLAQVMEARETRSWGEVAGLYGLQWKDLSQSIGRLLAKGVLKHESPSEDQRINAGINKSGERKALLERFRAERPANKVKQ